MKNELMEMK